MCHVKKRKRKVNFNDDPCKFMICIRLSSFSKNLCLIIFLPMDHLVSVNGNVACHISK